MRYKTDQQLEAQLDAGKYNESTTLLLKVPVPLPYQNNWNEYQRVDGEIIYHGQHYNAVKHRLFQDTMYTVYVKNVVKNKLYQKINDVVRLFTGVPASSSKNAHIWDNLLKEYLPLNNDYALVPFIFLSAVHPDKLVPALSSLTLPLTGHPPKAVA